MSGDEVPEGAHPAAAGGEAFEELLARCIEARDAGDDAGLQRLFAERPQATARLRSRLFDLERLGLLGPGEAMPHSVAGHRLLAQLGRGGMGAVYLAEEPDGARRVALKLSSLPLEDGEAGRRARARFEREVAAVVQLDHPRIVSMRSAGEHEGRPWFTMDHVRGATLSRLIERLRARGTPPEVLSIADVRAALAAEMEANRLPGTELDEGMTRERSDWPGSYVAWCCQVALDLAAALEHAHAHGVVHRDVKPSNAFVRPDGLALLFDFGLAQVRDQPSLTRSGDFAGTPYAVSPEQVDARRGPVDGRTDVWGLGVVLYELLALRRPFDGSGTAELLRRVLEADPIPLRRLHPGLARALENVCASALEKSPRRRYASATRLREDLERFRAGRPVLARGASLRRRGVRFVRRRPAAAAAAALGLLVVLGVPAGLLTANTVVRAHARRAERAAEEASLLAQANAEVVGHLVDLFEPLEAEKAAPDPATLALIEAQAQRLALGRGTNPLARAALLEATATVFSNLGEAARARPLYDRALAIREAELGELHPDTVALLQKLAQVNVESGDPEAALGLCRRASEALSSSGTTRVALAARVRATSARALSATGKVDEAAAELQAALALLSHGAEQGEAARAEVLEDLSRVEVQRGRVEQALARCEEALALRRAAWLPEPRALARGLDLLAELRSALGEHGAAEEARNRALALREALRAPADIAPMPPELRLCDPRAPEFEASFRAGITALQVRRLEEARGHFERCLELRPTSAVSMYNLACGNALLGEVSSALDWVERAVDDGFGVGDGRLEVVGRDADLTRLRGEPRFESLLWRLSERDRALRAYVREPAIRFPAEVRAGEPPPLLLVLHADGSSKDAVAAGPWARVAEELGWVLFAPSAPRPLGPTAEAGLAWIDDVAGFSRRPWDVEAACAAALGELLSERRADPRRVLVAGEGSGALVAFDLALRAPGLVRGVVLVNGPALLEVPEVRARTAAALGLRVAVRFDAGATLPWVDPAVSNEAYAQALEAWLDEHGLSVRTDAPACSLPLEPDARAGALAAALSSL